MDISTILYYKKLMKIVLYNRIRYPNHLPHTGLSGLLMSDKNLVVFKKSGDNRVFAQLSRKVTFYLWQTNLYKTLFFICLLLLGVEAQG